MTKKKRAEEIQKIFDVVYADAKCSLDYTTEHELLVAVQLSAQHTVGRMIRHIQRAAGQFRGVILFLHGHADRLHRNTSIDIRTIVLSYYEL